MRISKLAMSFISVTLSAIFFSGTVNAQAYSNPFASVTPWAQLPDGRTFGAVGDTDVDPDGAHVWAVIRCDAIAPDRFGDECVDSNLDSVIKFNLAGEVVESFGGGMFIWPHGIDVDPDGNVWVTDAVNSGRIPDGDERGHIVVKFSPTGDVLMTLGTPGESGNGANHLLHRQMWSWVIMAMYLSQMVITKMAIVG